jgi:nitrite reductase/ring-hydroxylating ferredoxin subunit
VAGADEVPVGHLFHGRLLGRELAVWRDPGGGVHAWDNRCPHRGVRLTAGTHCGGRIRCRYHAMEFDRDGACVHVPAHPGLPVPSRLRATAHACAEAFGLVWVSLVEPQDLPGLPVERPAGPLLALRPMPVRAPADRVLDALAGAHAGRVLGRTDLSLAFEPAAGCPEAVLFLLQPADRDRCIIRGVCFAPQQDSALLLRRYNLRLRTLRDSLEAGAHAPAPEEPLWAVEAVP